MATINIKSLLGQLNTFCKTGLESAAGICVARSHYEITVEHAIWQMIESPVSDFSLIAKHYGITHEEIKAALSRVLEEFTTGNSAKPVFSPRLIDWYQQAQLEGSVELKEPQIRSGSMFLAFITKGHQLSSPEITALFDDISHEDLCKNFTSIVQNSIEENVTGKAAGSAQHPGQKTALQQYCEDFTQKARDGHIDPVFGRDQEIRQVVDIFARRRKNNPIVVGEAGVGKTAIVEGLALRIVEGDVPDFLKNVSIMSLDMGLLQAGAGVKGEFENRLKNVIEEVKASEKPIIMFIDEAHTMIGAGGTAGGSDAANLLKPALARGELRTIAATTWSEYKKYFEKDAALARRFQLVYLEEPSEETTTLILRGLKKKYEECHSVVIRDDAIKTASEMAGRYISGRYLPDKAIDLLDTSSARVKVLLTAKPDLVENEERKLQALEREQEALKRDDIYGVSSDTERLEAIETEIEETESELEAIKEQWQQEQKLAGKLIALREQRYQLTLSTTETSDENEALHSSEPENDETPDETEDIGTDLQNDEIPDEFIDEMPSGADLDTQIDETLSALEALQEETALVKTEVDPEIVSQVVSDWTGIPVGQVMHDDAQNIIDMEENLKQRIKGQDMALAEISRIIKSSKTGLKDPEQPLGVFILAGPSGVGKTETGLGIAELLFGGERFTISVNMSEFQEKHTVSRLIGSPPGYVGYGEGGVLTEAVRQRPYSVVLLDEAEKANHEVMNLFYQVFDKGVLADGEGRNINFKNTIIFLTSNLASDIITELALSDKDVSTEQMLSAIRPVLSEHFKPALLARMSIVPYMPLSSDVMSDIVKIKLQKVADRLMETHGIRLNYAPEVTLQIALRCLEVETGARNIDHIMDGTILPLLSQELLTHLSTGEMPSEIDLCVDEDGAFILKTEENAGAVAE